MFTAFKSILARPTVPFWFMTLLVMGFVVPMLLGMVVGYEQAGLSQATTAFVTTYTSHALMPDLTAVPWYVFAGHLLVNNTICVLVIMAAFYITRRPDAAAARCVAFGILPYQALMGGILMGGLIDRVGLPYVAAAILPHGIIEIPTLCLAVIVAILLGQDNVDYTINVKSAMVSCIGAIVILVAIATLIEATVTPWIIQLVLAIPG
ncbi:MAG: stage II sporulation protein M [candidate division Zixibacteria bacterium]|jgi:stage II sporulation protein M|nr:stage II sporulation protein M [candidate division Zixibacteria bacterium]